MLALCADITVASESGRYGVNFTDLEFTPGMGATALLPALAGHGFASEMMLTAKLYKGRELAGRGLSKESIVSAAMWTVFERYMESVGVAEARVA